MHQAYSIETASGTTVIRFSSRPTLAEGLSALKAVSAIENCRRRLWVFSAGVDLSPSEIRKIAEQGKNLWPTPSRGALVVPDDSSFGQARMHDSYRMFGDGDGVETRAFRTEREALAWLENGTDDD